MRAAGPSAPPPAARGRHPAPTFVSNSLSGCYRVARSMRLQCRQLTLHPLPHNLLAAQLAGTRRHLRSTAPPHTRYPNHRWRGRRRRPPACTPETCLLTFSIFHLIITAALLAAPARALCFISPQPLGLCMPPPPSSASAPLCAAPLISSIARCYSRNRAPAHFISLRPALSATPSCPLCHPFSSGAACRVAAPCTLPNTQGPPSPPLIVSLHVA